MNQVFNKERKWKWLRQFSLWKIKCIGGSVSIWGDKLGVYYRVLARDGSTLTRWKAVEIEQG